MKNKVLLTIRFVLMWSLVVSFCHQVLSQEVDNKRCPQVYKRNNGNGQQVTEFASNISPVSSYFLSALSSKSQGNFTLGWGQPIAFPPVITKSWITDSEGTTSLNWAFGNNSSGSPFNPPGVPSGNEVKYTFYNNNLPTAGVITLEFTDPVDGLPLCICSYPLSSGSNSEGGLISEENYRVSSGSDGGLESQSLGNAVVSRAFSRVQQDLGEINYAKAKRWDSKAQARTQGFALNQLSPSESILGQDFTAYLSSPTDLVNMTNAEEVISIDYVKSGNNLATYFATKTSQRVYDHTKYVCDRLKGSEILAVDSVEIGGYYFLRTLLSPEKGLNEYAISFSVGFDSANPSMGLQSAWLLSDYKTYPAHFNFQFWSADGKLLQTLIQDLLTNLKSQGTLTQVTQVSVPEILVTKGYRNPNEPGKVTLKILNQSEANEAKVSYEAKVSETSNELINRQISLPLPSKGVHTMTLDLKDYAEAALFLGKGNLTTDYVFDSDGLWNYYLPEGASLNGFSVSNGTTEDSTANYPLMRKVDLSAQTSNYATIYRTIRGGGIPADLSGYEFLSFSAKGSGNLTLRLIKKSVEKFEDQYTLSIPLSGDESQIQVALKDFVSSGLNQAFDPSDIVMISFTNEGFTNSGLMQLALDKVRFTNQKEVTVPANQNAFVYPNPFVDKTNVVFKTKTGGDMILGVYNLATGNLIHEEMISTVAGENRKELVLDQAVKDGFYILKIRSVTESVTAKLWVQ